VSQRQYETERDLQHRFEVALAAAWPQIEVLDVEYDAPREHVRLFVDLPDGVDLAVCTRVTEIVRDECPELGLEVSSPGIDRPLRGFEHFAAAVGKRARIRLKGDKRAFHATIVGAEAPDTVLVRRAGHDTSERVDLAQLVRAKLDASDELSIGTPKPQPGAAGTARSTPGQRQPSTPTKGQV
jgi:ribosome maturation factor RimP